ncbi:hypothetical protein IGI37_003277 [Enterococcus sp. AZ194]|uniref:hypothetical protein n=1 Tax=Enterococcus sp. AZ194 TaxID=2774629 RepID=UPI003F28D9E8
MADNKKERWFSQKSLIDEVNKVSDEVIESLSQETKASTVDTTSGDAEEMERNMKRYERQIKILQAEIIQDKQLHEQELSNMKAELEELKSGNTDTSAQAEIAELKKENEQLKAQASEVVATETVDLSGEVEALNNEIVRLTADKMELNEQVRQLTSKNQELQVLLKEKDVQIQKSNEGEVDSEALLKAKRQINDLVEQNEVLKQEVVESQQEIGEVLVSAKKQANQMLEEAHVEAKHMISTAELELENIGSRAKKIFIEVEDSKEQVVNMYNEMQSKINQLVEGSLLSDYQSKK